MIFREDLGFAENCGQVSTDYPVAYHGGDEILL
jgi:hypothetical protein